MNFPKDPVMLLSVVNTALRDYYSSFEALVDDNEVDGDEIIAKLLGHNGTRSVGNYRRMGDMALAEETKDVREMLNNMLTRHVKGENEDE